MSIMVDGKWVEPEIISVKIKMWFICFCWFNNNKSERLNSILTYVFRYVNYTQKICGLSIIFGNIYGK